MDYIRRIAALKKRLSARKLDGLYVSKRENINYLCGFEGEGASLLITPSHGDFLITDARFKEACEEGLSKFDISPAIGPRYKTIADISRKSGMRRLGFEADGLAHSHYLSLKRALKRTRILPDGNMVGRMRMVKDADEIRRVRESAAILKRAYRRGRRAVKPGAAENRIAVIIDNCMRSSGAAGPAFDTIVAAGARSASPHGPTTAGRIPKNSTLLIDTGALYKGYNSDLTRTVFLGKISAKFKYIYEIVKEAQERAIRKVRPGAAACDADRAARDFIKNKGFGGNFIHSLGHGVGLSIHEPPAIRSGSRTLLRPGMVFTIEPGIYIRGWGGVRLEDMILVTKRGCEVLTDDIPK